LSDAVSALVSTDELATMLADGDVPVVILDVRWSLATGSMRDAYDTGHLPGAVFVDLDTELAAPPDGVHGRHPLPGQDDVEQAIRRAGVSRDSQVVCYDVADSMAAARAWWLLRYFGHPAGQVSVLDGGYAGWVAAGGPVEQAVTIPAPGDFVADPGHLALVDATEAAAIARAGVLLDARAEVRYRGEQEPVDPVAGHVPGAVSAPTAANVDDAGRFLSVEDLAARFAGLVGQRGQPVATYCGSGVNAAHQVLALELVGLEAGLYADSWSGWITDPERPVALGAEPG
jgi:thiosulfate/3-mercaptopyruvate sulfurtransferase